MTLKSRASLVSPIRYGRLKERFAPVGPIRSWFLVAGFLIISLVVHTADAQVTATTSAEGSDKSLTQDFKVVVGTSISHDSNQFKRPVGANPQADIVRITNAGLRLDKPFSQQRFQFDINQTASRYDKSTFLNSDALDYRGAWIWQLTSRLNGTLSSSHRESLVPFEIGGGTVRNLSISESRAFNLEGHTYGNWHLVMGRSQADQRSEQAVRLQPDFRSVSTDLGVKYITLMGNSIIATRRLTVGQYLNPPTTAAGIDNGFHQEDNELSMNWAPNAKSTFTMRLSQQSRTNNNPSQRNFSGPAVNVSYNWKPTNPLNLALSAGRLIGPLQDPSFSFITTDTYTFAPSWQISAKTLLRMGITHTSSTFGGSGVVPATGPGRRDALSTAEIGLDWSPMQSLSLSANLQRQKRSSNDPVLEFQASIAKVNASLTF